MDTLVPVVFIKALPLNKTIPETLIIEIKICVSLYTGVSVGTKLQYTSWGRLSCD